VYLSVSETVLKVSSQIREVWFTDKFRMFWNDPEHCLKRISLIEKEDEKYKCICLGFKPS
jgi:hypothetical protein